MIWLVMLFGYMIICTIYATIDVLVALGEVAISKLEKRYNS